MHACIFAAQSLFLVLQTWSSVRKGNMRRYTLSLLSIAHETQSVILELVGREFNSWGYRGPFSLVPVSTWQCVTSLSIWQKWTCHNNYKVMIRVLFAHYFRTCAIPFKVKIADRKARSPGIIYYRDLKYRDVVTSCNISTYSLHTLSCFLTLFSDLLDLLLTL